MKVSELGEFGLINLLAKMADSARNNQEVSWQQLIIGIWDDAAAWRSDAAIKLATTDSLIQDIHFSPGAISWEDLGWKAMAINLSDIAAMGSLPRYALVSLALPGHTEVADVTALYQGMIELAERFETAIIGGNISQSHLVTISITVLGSTQDQEKAILTRSAARPGDKIAVTGELGAAAAGVSMHNSRQQFSPEAAACFKKALRRPCPRIAEGQLLVAHGVKTAIDISDGLMRDLGHICQASQVGARIEIDCVSIQPEVRANFGNSALELVLSGGEDYELLFTADAEVIDKIKKAAPCRITVIGEITTDTTGEVTLVGQKGEPFNFVGTGWEHFAQG